MHYTFNLPTIDSDTVVTVAGEQSLSELAGRYSEDILRLVKHSTEFYYIEDEFIVMGEYSITMKIVDTNVSYLAYYDGTDRDMNSIEGSIEDCLEAIHIDIASN